MSFSISVEAVRFNQMLWNALLFTPKAGVTNGRVFFSVRTESHWDLTVFACDDFVVVQDSTPFRNTEQDNAVAFDNTQFALPLAVVKALETATRTITGDIEISIAEGKFLCLDSDQEVEVPEQIWGDLTELVGTEWAPTEFALDFYLNPDRLKQIPRMKIPGDHPVGFRYALHGDQTMVPFIYGPTVRGVITSMDEKVLIERGVYIWGEDTRPPLPDYKVGDKVIVGGIEFTKFADPETPPWDVDGPTNIDTGDKLAHVDKDQMQEFGY